MAKVLKVTLLVTLDELPQAEREDIADLEEVALEDLPGLADIDPQELGHLFMFKDWDKNELNALLFAGSGMYASVEDIECVNVEDVTSPC